MRGKLTDATIQRFGKRLQREARGTGYAARVDGDLVKFSVLFENGLHARADLRVEFARVASRTELDMEATRMGLALREKAATLSAEAG